MTVLRCPCLWVDVQGLHLHPEEVAVTEPGERPHVAEVETAGSAPPGSVTTKYRTIVADPPWRYRSSDILTRGWHRTASVETNKSTAGHYTTMTNAQIAALDVAGYAERDAALFMWVTNPKLYGERDGSWSPRQIIEAWGFRYVTLITWVKTGSPGLGFYFRGNTEHVLFCVRGDVRIPPALRESNVIVAPKRGHSEKPAAFYDLVERVLPGPYLELFARRQRLSWDTWGNEALNHVELTA